MTTPRFSISARSFRATSGDFILLLWSDPETPLFDRGRIPECWFQFRPGKKAEFRLVSLTETNGDRSAVCVHLLNDHRKDPGRAVRMAVAEALTRARKLEMKRVVIPIGSANVRLCGDVQEGVLLGGYRFDRYKSKYEKEPAVLLLSEVKAAVLRSGVVIAECTNFARDVLNEPPMVMNPATLSEAFVRFGRECGLHVSTWKTERLTRERCGGILAVGRGADVPPRLVIATGKSDRKGPHLALVGKGVTFDSGGYSLKPTKSMEDMKMDMAGAAMMFAGACAISKLDLPIRVSVFCPIVHNAISSRAYNVSDILRTRSGKTVEVTNTDAEGRIILSDALTLACEKKPDYLVDSATLTGAAVVALGEEIAAVYGTDRKFTDLLLKAGHIAGENLWEMPLHEAYNEQYDSDLADMKNSAGRYGGSIGAALFLQRFVKESVPWVHMDIAGPGCKTAPLEHLGKGAKGFGVKTIVELARLLVGA